MTHCPDLLQTRSFLSRFLVGIVPLLGIYYILDVGMCEKETLLRMKNTNNKIFFTALCYSYP